MGEAIDLKGVEELADECAGIAARAAGQFLAARGIEPDCARLSEELRVGLKEGVLPALAEFHGAKRIGMERVGEASFRASMALIGIEAARRAHGLPPAVEVVTRGDR